MTLPIAHIFNGELGFDVRTKLNDLIDLAGGGSAPFTPGSVPFADASGFFIQDNANFFWDGPNNLLTSGVGVKIKGATSGVVTVNTKAAAGTWTLTLPDTAGTNGYALTTNGSGVTSWTSAGGGGGMAIGGAISGGTASRVLFTGAGGILDDDSTFTWNDTLKDLAIGGAYYVNAARALYVVPHVSGNNWFEGSAGNQTVTGYNNFGTGDNALHAVTTGYNNVALGSNAALSLTSGFENFALGSDALRLTADDRYNVAIGTSSMYALGYSGAGGGGNTANVGIGFGAMNQVQIGTGNIAMGFNPMALVAGSTAANNNIVMGTQTGANLGSGASGGTVQLNTLVGPYSGRYINNTSCFNTWIGSYQGVSALINHSIVLADGGGNIMLDWGVTSPYNWSLSVALGIAGPNGLHIYNVQDNIGSAMTVYERAILDWRTDSNIFRVGTQASGSGMVKRLVAIDGFAKAGAPANTDLPSTTFAVIDDTSGGATWLVFNKAGTIRKVQLV